MQINKEEAIMKVLLREKGENGQRRIRTFEGIANRFTVCPLWPLGYLPVKRA
jgi:hypothetical protein